MTATAQALAVAAARLALAGDRAGVERVLALAADPARLAVVAGEARTFAAGEGDDVARGNVTSIRGFTADRLWRVYSGLDPIPVRSSNVASIAWDDAQHFLFVRFRSGALYAYAVPATTFTGFAGAGSKGKYVWDVLRGADGRRPARLLDLDRRYDYVRIE